MASKSFITALDIGTRNIRLLMVQQSSKKELELVTFIQNPVHGMTARGVSDIDQLAESLKEIVQQAEQSSSKKIKDVYLNVGGSRFKAIPTHSLISVSRADREISQKDIDRVLEAAKIINLPSNYEIWDVVPKEFIVDDQKGIQKPLGMKGARLEVEGLLLTIFTPSQEKIEKAVLKAGLNIQDAFISPLASAEAVLTAEEKEKGATVVDIGAGLTKLAIYSKGALLWTAIFPLGSENITDDLTVGLQIDFSQAEDLKKGIKPSADLKKKKTRSKVGVKEQSKIIRSRLKDILEELNDQVLNACSRQDLPAGIILTGGGAKLKGLEEIAKKEFKLPVKLGYCSRITGLEKDLSLSAVAGIALMAYQDHAVATSNMGNRFFRAFKKLFFILNP